MEEAPQNFVELTGDIVSAYVSANNIQRSELPGLIADVHSALTNLGKPASESVKAEPPVPIKQTIKPTSSSSLSFAFAFSHRCR
jgi:predicted transcriptional regulator